MITEVRPVLQCLLLQSRVGLLAVVIRDLLGCSEVFAPVNFILIIRISTKRKVIVDCCVASCLILKCRCPQTDRLPCEIIVEALLSH